MDAGETSIQAAREHYWRWTRRLSPLPATEFRDADRRNFYRACLVAAALGLFPNPDEQAGRPLSELLHEAPPADPSHESP